MPSDDLKPINTKDLKPTDLEVPYLKNVLPEVL